MSTLFIEICDAGLTAWNGASSTGAAVPGIAFVDGETVLTGQAAADQSRRRPRHVHHRFWEDLSDEPLGHPFPRSLRTADLAYAQLAALPGAGDGPVVLGVPGTWSDDQLALLLGIVEARGWTPAGLVDQGLLGAAGARLDATPGANAAARVLHLELHLHRLVLTVLAVDGGELVRKRIETADGFGLVELQDAWMKIIARRFVEVTRFDPLHAAESEQALYSALPLCLRHLADDGEADLAVTAGGREHVLELRRSVLSDAAAPFWEAAAGLVRSAATDGTVLVLSHRFEGLPGLDEKLDETLGDDIDRRTPKPALAAAARRRLSDALPAPGGAVPHVTRLPLDHGAP